MENGPNQLLCLRTVRLSQMTDETTSPERQDKETAEVAQRHDMETVALIEDLNVSASKVGPFKRPALGPWLTNPELIAKYDAIIWQRPDRAVRSMSDMHELLKWAQKHDKKLLFHNGFPDIDLTTPTGRLIATIIAYAAEMEAAAIRERVKSSQGHMKQNGRFVGGSIPYGYQLTGTGKLAQDEASAAVLLDVINQVIGGVSVRHLTKELSARKILSPADHQNKAMGRPVRGVNWAHATLYRILRSRALRGEMQRRDGTTIVNTDGESITFTNTPLLTESKFAELQQALIAQSVVQHRLNVPSMLLHVLYCGNCGQPLYRQSLKRDSYKSYYRCMARKESNKECNVLLRGEGIEQAFTDLLMERFAEVQRYERQWIPESDNSQAIKEIQGRLEELEDEWDTAEPTDYNRERYQTRRQRLLSRKAEMEQMPIKAGRYELVATSETYRQWFERSDNAGRREILVNAGIKGYAAPGDRLTVAVESARAHLSANPRHSVLHLTPQELSSHGSFKGHLYMLISDLPGMADAA